MDPPTHSHPAWFLVDNGSLAPAATLRLRALARALSGKVGQAVEPVSLLHSSAVPEGDLGGVRAEILEPALRARHAAGQRSFGVLPLFFGPSGALTEYLPRRIAALQAALPGLEVTVGRPLVDRPDADDGRLARLLADQVRATLTARALVRPVVVLVDHGSPQRAVAAVRDYLADRLRVELGSDARAVVAASMERREGPEFDFNEPLLERALAGPPCGAGAGDVVLAMLFFSPGRHAGPGGDIEIIARAAEACIPGLRVHAAPLVGEHPGLIDILADRLREVQGQEAELARLRSPLGRMNSSRFTRES